MEMVFAVITTLYWIGKLLLGIAMFFQAYVSIKQSMKKLGM